MKKKGFTLIELLGVIIVIGLIVLLAITVIMPNIRNFGGQLDDISKKVIDTAVEMYLDKYSNSYPKNNGAIYYVGLQELKDEELLEKKFLDNHFKKGEYPVVKISFNKSSPTYTYLYKKDGTRPDLIGEKYALNSYVWYSGFLWRMIAKNSDGSVKLIMEHSVTTLSFASLTGKKYNESYVRMWLNEYFLSKLKFTNLLVPAEWCASTTSDPEDTCYDFIGIRNAETIPTSTTSEGLAFTVNTTGTGIGYVRPVINIRGDAVVSSPVSMTVANGTSTTTQNVYVVGKDASNPAYGSKLNTVNISVGDYVKASSGYVWRVIEVGSDYLKLIQSTYATKTSYSFSKSNTSIYALTDTSVIIGQYLNSTFINDSNVTPLNDFYYDKVDFQGEIYTSGMNYNDTTLKKSNPVIGAKFFLPKLGEIMTVPGYPNGSTYSASNTATLTMTASSSNEIYYINAISSSTAPTINAVSANTTLYLITTYITNNASVSSGYGTPNAPYVIAP